jgi:hypothetical protein
VLILHCDNALLAVDNAGAGELSLKVEHHVAFLGDTEIDDHHASHLELKALRNIEYQVVVDIRKRLGALSGQLFRHSLVIHLTIGDTPEQAAEQSQKFSHHRLLWCKGTKNAGLGKVNTEKSFLFTEKSDSSGYQPIIAGVWRGWAFLFSVFSFGKTRECRKKVVPLYATCAEAQAQRPFVTNKCSEMS